MAHVPRARYLNVMGGRCTQKTSVSALRVDFSVLLKTENRQERRKYSKQETQHC